MFRKIAVAALVAAVGVQGSNAAAAAATPEGLMTKLSNHLDKASENAKRALMTSNLRGADTTGSDIPDICDLIKGHFGSDFANVGVEADCGCDGELTGTLTLTCEFGDVCEGPVCATVNVDATLEGFMDADGNMGDDPKLNVHGCVDTHIDMVQVMCLGLDFEKPDFFFPQDCSFTYGDYECDCKLEKMEGHIPCYEFDCSGADTPDEFLQLLSSSTCKTVDLSQSGNDGVTYFIPAFEDVKNTSTKNNKKGDDTPTITAMDKEFMEEVSVYQSEHVGN